MAAILKFLKFHLKPFCFEQYFCERHLGNMDVKFCKRINCHRDNHIEILKMTSRPLVANRSKKDGKDQESIQSSTTPDIGYLVDVHVCKSIVHRCLQTK